MLKPEELLPRETWTFVLSKLSTEDELSCRCVCKSFKNEVDSILNKNKDRLWLRHRDDDYAHYFCYDEDHRISSRDTLYFNGMIRIKNLKFVSKLMPSLKILQLDPLDQGAAENYYEEDPDYREYENCDTWDDVGEGIVVPITKIFPQVACLILPGQSETDNFVGDLSQVKHLTLLKGVLGELPTFSNLDSLEARTWAYTSGVNLEARVPIASKRFVVVEPHSTIKWRKLPKTLEVIETGVILDEYISIGNPHFDNLKILKSLYGQHDYERLSLESLVNFLKDHKGSLIELSFFVREDFGNIRVLVPLLTSLQKLSVEIKTDKQVMELKEIKALAHNLQYFELSFSLWSGSRKHLGPILENLPLSLDNLSIKGVRNYEEINTFMEKIMEKVVNGDTKRVTIAGVDDTSGNPDKIIKEIINISPSPVRVEGTDRVFEDRWDSPGHRTEHFGFIWDIAISL